MATPANLPIFEQGGVNQRSPAQAKIALFRSLFHGREDVYPQRWLIAQRGVNTLVLVHRRQLQLQWIERLSTFLGIPARTIGRIGGGRTKATGLLDVAVIQSMVRSGLVERSREQLWPPDCG